MSIKKSDEHKLIIHEFEEQIELLGILSEKKQDKINTYVSNLFVHFKSDVAIIDTNMKPLWFVL